MRILHLSADYPDPLQPAKTRAVANLLPLVPEHEHLVYSLNRVDWRLGICATDFADAAGAAHRAVAYGAPPRGLFLERFLNHLADWILDDLARRGLRPDIAHAHKLSVEGLAAGRIAEALGLPLVVSIQGNSDLKIVGVKRGLRHRYRAIWRGARVVFPFAPWAETGLAALLDERRGPTRRLPCPAGRAETRLSPVVAGPTFVTAFHFRDWRNKNADGLIRAVGLASARVPDIRLRVLGGGDPDAFARLRSLAERYAPGRVRFEGAVPNERIGALFNAACSASTTLSVTVNHLGRFQAAGLVCLELFFAQGSPLSWLSVMVVAGVLLSASLLEAAARWRKLSAFISRIAA